MKFGVREICEVVLRAKTIQKVGNKLFYKHEPVMYFDSLKTSSMEGSATTVYAQGGRGNSRLMAWEGERTLTFTMEDALISAEGFMLLTGAGLIEPTDSKPIMQHIVETTDDKVTKDNDNGSKIIIYVKEKPHTAEKCTYVMPVRDGELLTEPMIPCEIKTTPEEEGDFAGKYAITIDLDPDTDSTDNYRITYELNSEEIKNADAFLVDYYTARDSHAKQIDITPDKFGGYYYLEASTLFRDTNGSDLPAEFIIPNCKIQSNFNFSMASTGDPSTFTFTLDAFPGYTRWDSTKKVLAAIQVFDAAYTEQDAARTQTVHEVAHEKLAK